MHRCATSAASPGQNEIPRVAGQHYDYIVKQLQDFKARARTNDAGNMTSVARTLSERISRTSVTSSRHCADPGGGRRGPE